MASITIEEARAQLPRILEELAPGEELIITRDARPIARLVGLPAGKRRPKFGRGRGKLVVLSEDDEHLKDFAEYMP